MDAVERVCWDKGRPTNIQELFVFYNEYVKLLYASVQASNKMPNEMLFELNAALDHLSRRWIYLETEQEVVAKAFSHLKRACLDAFKIKFMETDDNYKKLCQIETGIIDNGDFDRKLHIFFNKLRRKVTKARKVEGQPDSNKAVPAFELWEEVYTDCVDFNENFFLHEKINWAKRRGWKIAISRKITELILSFLAGCLSSFLVWWFTKP